MKEKQLVPDDAWDAAATRRCIQAALDAVGIVDVRPLEERAGVGSGSLRKFLKGTSQSLALSSVVKLAHAAGLTVSQFLREEVAASPSRPNPLLDEVEVKDIQHQLGEQHDGQTVLTGIAMRFEGAIQGMTLELRGLRSSVDRLGLRHEETRERVAALEAKPEP